MHITAAVGLAAMPAFARQWPVFERLQFLSGVVGWREAGDTVRTQLAEERYGASLSDTRELAAELLYCLRDVPVPLYVWPSGPVPSITTR